MECRRQPIPALRVSSILHIYILPSKDLAGPGSIMINSLGFILGSPLELEQVSINLSAKFRVTVTTPGEVDYPLCADVIC